MVPRGCYGFLTPGAQAAMLGKKKLPYMIKRPCDTRKQPYVPGLTTCAMTPCVLEKVRTRKRKYSTPPNSPTKGNAPQPGGSGLRCRPTAKGWEK